MTDQILKLNYQLTVLKEQHKEIKDLIDDIQDEVDRLIKSEYNLNENVDYSGLK